MRYATDQKLTGGTEMSIFVFYGFSRHAKIGFDTTFWHFKAKISGNSLENGLKNLYITPPTYLPYTIIS